MKIIFYVLFLKGYFLATGKDLFYL